ncbi:hypothetical protein [Gracilimonas sp.]|uniref:hypothetical protein n=1 Tax=Gracilimonas sp. TaxID=1974203 RepID=UPI003BA92B4E
MENSNYKEFIKKNSNNIQKREVNLTHDQVELVEGLAKWMDLSFGDTVMVMVHQQLLAMDKTAEVIDTNRKSRLN